MVSGLAVITARKGILPLHVRANPRIQPGGMSGRLPEQQRGDNHPAKKLSSPEEKHSQQGDNQHPAVVSPVQIATGIVLRRYALFNMANNNREVVVVCRHQRNGYARIANGLETGDVQSRVDTKPRELFR